MSFSDDTFDTEKDVLYLEGIEQNSELKDLHYEVFWYEISKFHEENTDPQCVTCGNDHTMH